MTSPTICASADLYRACPYGAAAFARALDDRCHELLEMVGLLAKAKQMRATSPRSRCASLKLARAVRPNPSF